MNFTTINATMILYSILQFRWVTTERTRPHVHILNFAGMWARAAGVCCLHFSEELYSAHWAVLVHVNAKYYTARHTCCGSLMRVHSISFTCAKNSTASHTKSSGIQFKVTLSTLLCTRLPAGRQVGKWAVSNVSVPLQDTLHIFDKSCITWLKMHELFLLA